MRDVLCADGHENVVSVLFSVDAAQVKIFFSTYRVNCSHHDK